MNKLNKKDMLELARKVRTQATLKELGISVGVLMDMAYQLHYFFVAVEKIEWERAKGNLTKNDNDNYKSGADDAFYDSLEILSAALIYKEKP